MVAPSGFANVLDRRKEGREEEHGEELKLKWLLGLGGGGGAAAMSWEQSDERWGLAGAVEEGEEREREV